MKNSSRSVSTGHPLSADLSSYFVHHSKSFSFAARFFGKRERISVRRVYAFCRVTDDLVDTASSDASELEIKAQLDEWAELARQSYNGVSSGTDWLDDLMRESREKDVSFAVVDDLLSGVRSDIGKVKINTVEELNTYAYRVGSTVGLWLCGLQGVKDDALLARAVDLGKAMQLSNILRDVGEDLTIDRIYLPKALLEKHGLNETELRVMMESKTVSDKYRGLITEVMSWSERLYASAWEGIPLLPTRFARAAAVAAEIYRAINIEVMRNDFDNMILRAHTSTVRKVILAAAALVRLNKLQSGSHQQKKRSGSKANVNAQSTDTDRPVSQTPSQPIVSDRQPTHYAG